MGPSGIWKPAQFDLVPISITTTPHGPYNDSVAGEDGLLNYRYRGTDPNHRDNAGLREAMRTRTPLVYFFGIMPGRYLPVWPVFVVNDNPLDLSFQVAIDPAYAIGGPASAAGTAVTGPGESVLGIRRYIAAFTLRRLHQTAFRESVITAYSSTCTLCRLKHRELLDAAHIIPDNLPLGDPIIKNGLCLCKIHHAAYDQNLIGISPDFVIHVRDDVLDESDGPMLLHGLQELHKRQIILPARKSDRPDPERLDLRFQEFRKAV
jgi:putative restriction endonuclease